MIDINQIKNRVCLAIFCLGISLIGLDKVDNNVSKHQFVKQSNVEVISVTVKECL